MKIGFIITQSDPETVFNALRLALYGLERGDAVSIFLSGRGVEIEGIEDSKFDVGAQVHRVLDAGGRFFACGSCLKLRGSEGSEICPLSTLKEEYDLLRDSDRIITV
jgi:sulfur relay (sulfurtransferase) complex TusBCD TusD component (DsrE family)